MTTFWKWLVGIAVALGVILVVALAGHAVRERARWGAAHAKPGQGPAVRVVSIKHQPVGAAAETLRQLLRSGPLAQARGALSIAENEPAGALILVGPAPLVDRLEDLLLQTDKAAAERREMEFQRQREMRERELAERGPGPLREPGGPPPQPGMGPMGLPQGMPCPMMQPRGVLPQPPPEMSLRPPMAGGPAPGQGGVGVRPPMPAGMCPMCGRPCPMQQSEVGRPQAGPWARRGEMGPRQQPRMGPMGRREGKGRPMMEPRGAPRERLMPGQEMGPPLPGAPLHHGELGPPARKPEMKKHLGEGMGPALKDKKRQGRAEEEDEEDDED